MCLLLFDRSCSWRLSFVSSLKEILKGPQFADAKEIQNRVTTILKTVPRTLPILSRSYTNVIKSVLCLVATTSKVNMHSAFLLYHSPNFIDKPGSYRIFVLYRRHLRNITYCGRNPVYL